MLKSPLTSVLKHYHRHFLITHIFEAVLFSKIVSQFLLAPGLLSHGKIYGNKFKHKVWSVSIHNLKFKYWTEFNYIFFSQKINGWKIYHLTSQMEDVIDMENELTSRLSTLQKKLDKNALNEVSKDVTKVQELIKANLQRSKVIEVNKIISITNKTNIKQTWKKTWNNL